MTVTWSVRPAQPTDVEAIYAIEQACVEAPHWSKAAWRGVFAENSAGDLKRVSFVAEDSGRITGFVVVSCARGIAELESVVVGEEARRRGVGRALCNEAMEWSRSEMALMIELEVRASSTGALALYGSLGFAEQGRRQDYYHNPMEDAVLMSAPLPEGRAFL